jgi:hypothetical protein
MIHSTTILRRDQHLLYTNFTKSNTMEGKREGTPPTHGARSLADLKKEMTELTILQSLATTGGLDKHPVRPQDESLLRRMEQERWNSHCGGIVPQ